MDNELKWDLDAILEEKPLEDLYKKWEKQNEKLVILYPNFLNTVDNFKRWLKESEKFEILNNRIFNYISNSLNEELDNPVWIGWMQKLEAKSNEFAQNFSDFENVIIKNKNIIKEYLEEKSLKEYTLSFERILKYSKYILDKKTEAVLTKLSINDSSVEDIYSTLTDNDLTFEDAIDKNGKKVKLNTQADVFKNLKSLDPDLRKSTWLSFHNAFYKFRNTLTKSLYYNYLLLNTNATVRGFEDYIAKTAFDDEIEKSFILNVYDNVKKFKPNIDLYYATREKILKKLFELKKVNPWDMALDLSKKTIKYTIDGAKADVLKAVEILGEEYTQNIQRAFDESWISWLPAKNKQTGAYSIGNTKGLQKYYISMNFDNTLRSVYTLAHELGHSMHTYYFSKSQKIYQGCSIFYAEIASITNEMFLNFYLLEKYKKNNEMKLAILDEMISNFIATTTRQVIFSNFEYKCLDLIKNQCPFTYESIQNIYFETINEYMSYDKDITKEPYSLSMITPLRISHFYVGNFYVYKYAIGQIAATIISNRIKNDETQKEKLFKFLSSGNSKTPLETIKLLDIDLQDENTWNEVNEILNKLIEEFNLVAKELKLI